MQWIHVTILLRNTLQHADTWVTPFLRGHHMFRHVLLCFPPLVVLAWLCGLWIPRIDEWFGCVEPCLMPVFHFLGAPSLRTKTFTAQTHTVTNPQNKCTCQHTRACMDIKTGRFTQTHPCMWQTLRPCQESDCLLSHEHTFNSTSSIYTSLCLHTRGSFLQRSSLIIMTSHMFSD